MVGDGTVGRQCDVNQGDLCWEGDPGAGVRGFIVAKKAGNAAGAKGARKMNS